MGIAFIHDHKFRRIAGQLYSPGGLSNGVLTRYTEIFGSVAVVGRILNEQCVNPQYSEIINDKVSIQTAENLEQIIAEAQAVIIRLPSMNGYRAVRLCRKLKKPYLVEVVGCTWDAYWNYSLIGKLAALPAYCIMRMCVKNAPYAVYVTKHFLQKRYPCKGKTEAVSDVALQTGTLQVLDNRLEKLNSSNKKLVLGTAAALDVPYKGQEYVIRALPYIMEKVKMPVEYQLIGAGSPERLKEIARQCGVEANLVCKGVLPHNQVFSWLDEIDIYLQPSLLEGLSRALIEAMSRALPCIATDCGGNPELLDARCLVSAKPRKTMPQMICDCVVNLLEPQNRAQQALRNYKVATEQYNNTYLTALRKGFYMDFAEYAGINDIGRDA